MSSDIYYLVNCPKCENKLEIRFTRNNMKLIAICPKCNMEFELQSKDLEWAFFRQYFIEQNSSFINDEQK